MSAIQWVPIEKIRIPPGSSPKRPNLDVREIEAAQDTRVIPPVLLRPADKTGEYYLVGEGRGWWIAQQAMIPDVPATISDISEADAEAFEIHPDDPIQKARAWKYRFEQEKQKRKRGALTRAAQALGVGKATLHRWLKLLELHPDVQQLVSRGELSPAVAHLLHDKPRHKQLAYAEKWKGHSIRSVRAIIGQSSHPSTEAEPSVATPSKSLEDLFQESSPDLESAHLENELGERVGLPTRLVSIEGRGGVIAFRYHNLEELEGLLERLGWEAEPDF